MTFVAIDALRVIKSFFRDTLRVSHSFDPDQAQQNVWPDLGPNCSQKITAANGRRHKHARRSVPYSDKRVHSFPFSRDLTIPHLDLSHFALCIMGN